MFCVVTVLLLSLFCQWAGRSIWGAQLQIRYLLLVLMTPVGAFGFDAGDLSASLIKRQCGVKDYGSLMPGHGGIVDRFDSVFFVLPFVFLFIRLFPIVR